jgi:hypothetical protein
MPNKIYTQAENKAFFDQLLALPQQRLLAAILFLMLAPRNDRVKVATTISQIS